MRKKTTMLALVLVGLASTGWSQSTTTATEATPEVKEQTITFASEEERAKKMAAIQEVIDANKDNPKADLTLYYKELEMYKNAEIVTPKK
jgi:ABC-type glycerol-3-phosphate transport system substrate-binding protein